MKLLCEAEKGNKKMPSINKMRFPFSLTFLSTLFFIGNIITVEQIAKFLLISNLLSLLGAVHMEVGCPG